MRICRNRNTSNFSPIIIVLWMLIGFPAPAVGQNVNVCGEGEFTEFQLVEQMIQELDDGNYIRLANLINIDQEWSNADINSITRSVDAALNESSVLSCTLLQKKQYSDEFKTEVILVQFEETNLHFFVAAVLRDSEWVIIRLQLESDFDTIFEYLN